MVASAASPSECPDADELLRFVDKRGSAATRTHVERCESCRLVLSAFSRTVTGAESEHDSVVDWVEQIQERLRNGRPTGSRLGRYEILDRAGVGGMGVVYRAHDPELDRQVAIKMLHSTRGGDAEQRRLQREARALAKLAHPNVVSVFDVGEEDGHFFIAMEFVDGQTLRDWLLSEPSPSQILDTFTQAGRGLAAAHARGLVHRDFKPDNVLIGEDGRVRVTDFGLVRSCQPLERSEVTRKGVLVGTLAYMSPEAQRGDEADARSDQFGFAVALYQALTGHHPRPYLPLMEASQERRLSRAMRRLLRRALSPDPAMRFPSMDALLAELDRCRPSAPLPRRAAVVAVVAAVAGVALWASQSPETPKREVTSTEPPNTPPAAKPESQSADAPVPKAPSTAASSIATSIAPPRGRSAAAPPRVPPRVPPRAPSAAPASSSGAPKAPVDPLSQF